MFNFIPNRLALIVLISACSIILISMGLRQTFGLFFDAFEKDEHIVRLHIGLEDPKDLINDLNSSLRYVK